MPSARWQSRNLAAPPGLKPELGLDQRLRSVQLATRSASERFIFGAAFELRYGGDINTGPSDGNRHLVPHAEHGPVFLF